MKKLLLLLIAVVALGEAAADVRTEAFRPQTPPANYFSNGKMIGDSAKFFKENNPFIPRIQSTGVIYTQPEGELKAYYRSGGAFAYSSDNGLQVVSQGGKAYVVYGEDGKVYLRNPVYGLNTNTWIEGTINEDGTKITVPLGQALYEEDGATLDLCWASTSYYYPDLDDEGHVGILFDIDENVHEAVYSIDGECIYLEGSYGDINADFPENTVMTGLSAVWSDTHTWNGAIDYGTVYSECSYVKPLPVISEQPEGELVEYFRYGESWVRGVGLMEQEGITNVVYGNDGKIYLKDPIYGIRTGAWVEGFLSNDSTRIIVPMDQCIYWDYDEESGLILKNLTVIQNKIVYLDDELLSYAINNRVTEMTYRIDGYSLHLEGTYGDMYAEPPTEMCCMGIVWSKDLTFMAHFDWNTIYRKVIPAVPADPSLDEIDTGYVNAWNDCGNEGGGSWLCHYIKLEDVEGYRIDENRLSYSIFTDDDQVFTFKADKYPFEDGEDKTELPYTLRVLGLGPHFTHFYRTNAEGYEPFFKKRIGIQLYYTIDGVRNASNIVYCGIDPAYAKNGVPCNPTADVWHDCGNESGYSKFGYTIYYHTVDGEPMDPDRIYYSIFTDEDNLFTFMAEEYSYDIDEDMTLLPYNLNGTDVHNNYCYFYRTNAMGYEPFFNHQIGIQVYYLCDNGEMSASDIVYLEVFEYEPNNVNEVAIGKAVTEVKYFNMTGQQLREPDGICIAVTTCTDGTIHTAKVVK